MLLRRMSSVEMPRASNHHRKPPRQLMELRLHLGFNLGSNRESSLGTSLDCSQAHNRPCSSRIN
jgi:hypothetical protein